MTILGKTTIFGSNYSTGTVLPYLAGGDAAHVLFVEGEDAGHPPLQLHISQVHAEHVAQLTCYFWTHTEQADIVYHVYKV